MKKIWTVAILAITLNSCGEADEKKTSDSIENQEQQETVVSDFSSLVYLSVIGTNQTSRDLTNYLPESAKIVSETEDAIVYSMNQDGIEHKMTFLFYGESTFSEAIIELRMEGGTKGHDKGFDHIREMLSGRHGKPSELKAEQPNKMVEWTVEKKDVTEYYTVTQGAYLTYTMMPFFHGDANYEAEHEAHFLEWLDDHDSTDEDGEWVQVGPDGRWVFYPN
jgi:hypothetical protein